MIHLARMAKLDASLKHKFDRARQVATTKDFVHRSEAIERGGSSRTRRPTVTPARASDSLPPDSTMYQAITGNARGAGIGARTVSSTPAGGDPDHGEPSSNSDRKSRSQIRP